MVFGHSTVDSITFTTDDTGDGTDIVLPTGSISTGEILDDTITAADLNATLSFADGDLLDLDAINVSSATEGLFLPQNATACSAATAEGQICWDTAGEDLYIGNGTAAVQMNGGAVAWNSITNPTGDLTLTMAANNTTFNWDPTADSAETAFRINYDGEDTLAGGDVNQYAFYLNQSSNGTDVDEAADALLAIDNTDANEP